jgi:O-antigen ligase/polysaccharide polymerase Wzy-like membrane protein
MVPSRSVHAAGQRVAVLAAAVGACFSALFFAGGFDDAPLLWIGGLTLLVAASLAAGALLGVFTPPRLGPAASGLLGGLVGLAVWAAASTAWSASPDRSWTYANRTLVYAGFALLGFLLSALVPRLGGVAAAAAALLGLVLGWALLAKCVPALYSDYGRVARLRAPVGYWNELALLCDVTVPVALWLAVPRGRRAALRAAGALLLFAATVVVLLTYSRVGVVLACVAAAAWVGLGRDRVESIVAVALAGGAGAAVFGVALALPGITNDGQPRAVRAHDGWIFALVLLGAGAVVVAVALVLARVGERHPLEAERRRRFERIAAIAALAVAVAGLAASLVFADHIWSEFANPVTSQISSSSGRLGSVNSSNRWRWWTESWQAFTDHPLGGTGAGTFELTDRRLRRSPLVTTEPHNVPLQFLAETGIVGFLLFAAVGVGAVGAAAGVRRRATGAERAAATALGLVVVVFLAHTVVDMDWNYVATCGPLLLVAGVLAGRGVPRIARVRDRRPLLAVAVVLFALGACYSLAAPWLAQRQLATASSVADMKRAHSWDPLSTDVLVDWAALEDAHPLRAESLYLQAVSLEPQSSSTWFLLGTFYAENNAWKLAYDAFSKAWTYDRFGPAGIPCGSLDQARHEALGVWPPSCPRGRLRAATP